MKKILVTGTHGQLGADVVKELANSEYQIIGVDKDEMDLRDSFAIKETLNKHRPDVIIHCGAYTDVERAEDEYDTCMLINGSATRDISSYASKHDIPIIYISTDYVFDGTKDAPYTEEDVPNPLNVYGRSKLLGEQYIAELCEKYFILRISWVFGIQGHNFVKTMLRLSKKMISIDVVNDQFGTPTATRDVAVLIKQLLVSDKYGLYHVTNEGECSWAEFAKEIFRINNKTTFVNQIPASSFATKAMRPQNSRMSKQKLVEAGFLMLPHWQDSLKIWSDEYGQLERV